MIARINGTLLYKSTDHTIIDAGGIGYRIFVPLTTFYELPSVGHPVTLNIHTHFKQDAINLFGFHTDREKEVFLLMISVAGIGPRLAMNILSGITPEELIIAVSRGNLSRLVTVPGVGKKMAERMVVELREKMARLSAEEEAYEADESTEENRLLEEDALSALVNLGYKKAAAKSALEGVVKELTETVTLDMLLKKSLKILSG